MLEHKARALCSTGLAGHCWGPQGPLEADGTPPALLAVSSSPLADLFPYPMAPHLRNARADLDLSA